MEKYLIVGLGNPGPEYHETRHNAGWMVVDSFVKEQNADFADRRYGFLAETSVKGRKVFVLKPTTYMNLSGNAVRYWLEKEKIPNENLLVIVDDIAIPLGKMRLRASGSNGGHNGLGHIQQLIGQNYSRLRIGIGNDFGQGQQIDWVLGKFSDEEKQILQPCIETAGNLIKSFILAGVNITMNQYNRK